MQIEPPTEDAPRSVRRISDPRFLILLVLTLYPFLHSLLLLVLYYRVDADPGVLAKLPLNMERWSLVLYTAAPLALLVAMDRVQAGARFRALQVLGAVYVVALGAARSLQTASIVQSRRYLTREALANVEDIGFVLTTDNVIAFLLCMAPPAFAAFLILRLRPSGARRLRASTVLAALAITVTACTLVVRVADQPYKQIANDHGIVRGPEQALWSLVFARPAFEGAEVTKLPPDTVRKLRRIGVEVDPDAPLPFVKETVFAPGTPRPWPAFETPPDVVIVLAESLSAELLGCYGSPFPGITPAMDALAARSTRFTRYFNHTEPTISGVHGTVSSLHEVVGHSAFDSEHGRVLWETQVLTIAHVLRERGYETTYLNAGSKHYTHFEEVAANLGFENGVFRDRIETEFPDVVRAFAAEFPGAVSSRYLSDVLMFRVLDAMMRKPSARPRLVVLSTVGTHFPYEGSEGIVYADGGKPLLNALHTLDRGFGEGTRFLADARERETVLVLTGDHAMFPTPQHIEIAGKDYRKGYYEEIALLLHRTGQPAGTVDDTFGSSVDLVPTLLHLLDVNVRNPFMGRSLFAERGTLPMVIGSQSEHLFACTPQARSFVDIGELDRWPGIDMGDGEVFTAQDFDAWLGFLHASMIGNRIWKR